MSVLFKETKTIGAEAIAILESSLSQFRAIEQSQRMGMLIVDDYLGQVLTVAIDLREQLYATIVEKTAADLSALSS